MKIENIDFFEAARTAGEIAGVKIPATGLRDEKDERKNRIFEANRIAGEFFSMCLESGTGSTAVDFLEKRGLNQDYWKKFGLGYAPAGGKLVSFLNEKKLHFSDFEQAGLITRKEKDYVDIFRHRIVIPIYDHRSNIVGFGARALEDQQQPKYLNTPENYVFKKGNLFYGLNLAKDRIKTAGFSIIVEGYFDLIKMHLAGFENTIAPLGTAITENHLRLLKRWTNRILLVFDSDSAGTSAAFRSLETILANGFEVKIGIMPSGFDPEDFLDNYGAEALKKLLNQARDFVDFAIHIGNQKYPVESPKGRAYMVEEILRLIKNIPDEIERSFRVKELSEKTGAGIDILSKQMNELPEKSFSQDYKQPIIKPREQHAVENAEKSLIKIMLNQPEWANEITGCQDLMPESVRLIMDCCKKKEFSEDKISRILNRLNDPEHVNALTMLILKEKDKNSREITKKEFYDCVGILCRKFFEKRMKELEVTIKQKMANSQPYEKELEEMNNYILLRTSKNIEQFLSGTERSDDGKKWQKIRKPE